MNEFNQVRFDFDFLHATKKHKLETAHLLQILTEPTAKEAHKIRLYYIEKWLQANTGIAADKLDVIRERYKIYVGKNSS